MKQIYSLDDLQQLRCGLFELDLLVHGLWMDNLPITREYLQEKFDAVLEGQPITLHPVLEKFYEENGLPPLPPKRV